MYFPHISARSPVLLTAWKLIAIVLAVKDVMDCFRGVLQLNEFSDRTLALTLDVIDANPANYTVW